ncbi:unnamed protein product [Gordionus sp. m RMFG-2023]|uniref:lipoamide acyltransferase component of branched-chain alpha-keto acid dehydrogenase complex, mitochondrial-like isoform X2 n=1 Tax=Gordionus sp. m RMFG-2023 TaxID=3053472 RepID=UPI0030DFD9E6
MIRKIFEKSNFRIIAKYVHSNNYNFGKKIIPFNLSDIGEGIKEVVVKEWYIKQGDTIKQFDRLCEVQSDKASVTISSRYDGTVAKLHASVEDTVNVGHPLIDVEIFEENSGGREENDTKQMVNDEGSEKIDSDKTESTTKLDKGEEFLRSTRNAKSIPMVRKLAKDLGIVDLGMISGTGPDGRITEGDVRNYVSGGSIKSGKIILQDLRSSNIEKLKGARKAMIKSMNKNLTIPQFVLTEAIQADPLLDLRKRTNHLIRPAKLSLMPFIIKTASMALTKFPIMNSTFEETEETLYYKSDHNIGVAIDTDCLDLGLIVPNIKKVQDLSIIQIGQDLDRLIQQCKMEKKPKMEDLKGGTFTISNIGAIGGLHSMPLILWPEVAIVAIGKITDTIHISEPSIHKLDSSEGGSKEKIRGILERFNSEIRQNNPESLLAYNDRSNMKSALLGENSESDRKLKTLLAKLQSAISEDSLISRFKVSKTFHFSVSADHRIIDGATVAKFLTYWKSLLENPQFMIAQLK